MRLCSCGYLQTLFFASRRASCLDMAVPSDLAEGIPEPSSPPSLKPCCPAPSFTSFYRLILATCFSSCSLSPHSLSISLWKGHLADSHSALFTPLLPPQSPDPYFIFLHVRFWSPVPRQKRRVLSVSSDGRIVSAVFTQRPPVLTELAWLDDVPPAQQVPT